MKTRIQHLFVALVWLALPVLVKAQFTFTTNNGTITITGYNTAAGLNVVIPAATNGHPVTSIGDFAFENDNGIIRVTIPNSITNIGFGAFENCSSLTSVTIGNSVTSIGHNAFEGCTSLTNVTIPNSVTSIGDEAFVICTSLTIINVDTANPAYSSLGGVLFDKAQATLLEFPGGLGGSYAITNSVTSIGDWAFELCTGLRSVTIPNSVTSIGHAAFSQCSGLTNATIGSGVTSFGDDAFADCYNLTSVTIPGSVTNMGVGAFYDCGLTSVTIPNSVTSIGNGAFDECTSLTSVTIPNSITSIGSSAFFDCSSLTSVYFTGNAPSPTNDSTVFSSYPYGSLDPATVYYLPGTTGWGAMFDGLPTKLWFRPNPQILNHSAGFGVQPDGFGFTISWATNVSVVVEAATNLANPVWIPVSTNALTGGTNHFSDPHWTNYPSRFYRLRSQ